MDIPALFVAQFYTELPPGPVCLITACLKYFNPNLSSLISQNSEYSEIEHIEYSLILFMLLLWNAKQDCSTFLVEVTWYSRIYHWHWNTTNPGREKSRQLNWFFDIKNSERKHQHEACCKENELHWPVFFVRQSWKDPQLAWELDWILGWVQPHL